MIQHSSISLSFRFRLSPLSYIFNHFPQYFPNNINQEKFVLGETRCRSNSFRRKSYQDFLELGAFRIGEFCPSSSYPTSTPYSSFPFLPFPSLETGAYHVYQTVDPRDFPRTFKLTLTHSLAHRIKRTLSNRYQTIELSAALIDPHRLSSTREHQTHQKRTRNQKEKYGTSPFDCYSSSCISNCVFTNKLGEVAEDIWPGARPVLSFPLSFPHPPPFPAPTVLDSPYSPHLFSLDHDLRYELPYTRFDSSSSLLLLLALHQIMTTADSAPPCLYRCTMIM